MFGYRRALSAAAAGTGAILGLLVFASAIPAASGHLARERPFLTGSVARGQAIRVVESLDPSSVPNRRGASKLDGRLAGLARGAASSTVTKVRTTDPAFTPDGRVLVVIESRRPAAVEAIVARFGGRVERTAGTLVQAAVPPSALRALSQTSALDFIRAPFLRVEQAVTGEEVATSLAAAWHGEGFTGKGVKVAVIDGGFQGLPARQAAGELPANVVAMDFCGGRFGTATDHGTAVAEIVHEMAPDAQLYLLCIDTEVDLAAAVSFAKSQGVEIINHSVGWFGPARGDGSGYIGDIVANAKASGILWVNAAGNEAQTHWSGTFSDVDGDRVHAWAPNGDEGNTFIWPHGVVICGILKWDEWPAGISDFDLGLVLSGANRILALSAGDQTGSQPPIEGLCAEQTSGADLTVYWAILGYRVSTSPRLDLFSLSPPLQYQTAAGSVVDPATSSAALAVGALCWQTRQLEFYSSQGPTIDGRTKPDIVGHDSVSGATYGLFSSCPSAFAGPSGFAGTSASSPEVAGAAALVKQAYPAFGADQLRQFLQRSALDLGPPGADNATGEGELRMPRPPDLVAPSAEALPSSGRKGKILMLVSRVSDDRGEVRVVEQVKRNGRVVATIAKNGFISTSGMTRVVSAWKAPANATGSYQHCVRATDRAGNASPVSCAKVILK